MRGSFWQWCCAGIAVLTLGYYAFVRNYAYPDQVVWDESYFIVSVERYLGGYMFMENHPPLAKLIMAFGEYLLHPNDTVDRSKLIKDETVQELPDGYSFSGIRFFPVLAAWVSCLVFFILCATITGRPWPAFVLTLPYVLQNAFIRHFQAAMLDGIQIFFLLCALVVFTKAWQSEKIHRKHYVLLGFFIGCALSVKMNAIVFLLLPPLLALRHTMVAHTAVAARLIEWVRLMWTSGGTLAGVFCLVWYTHFSIATRIHDEDYYRASDSYKSILAAKATSSILAFPIMLRDSIAFSINFNRGVPRLDECNVNENGSSPIRWLVGGKAIKYGWKTDGEKTRYFYLVPNPIGWWYGTLSIVLSLVLVIGRVLYKTPIEDRSSFSLLCVVTLLWTCYVLMLSQMERAMYLYHYFVPLVLSLTAGAILFRYLFESDLPRRRIVLNFALALFAIQVAGGYFYMRRLTYGLPVTPYEVVERAWLATWQVEPNR